jgi:hypothetical protein
MLSEKNLFHIAFYTSQDKTLLSGKTYEAYTILEAIEKYRNDEKLPSILQIKYIANVANMTQDEITEIKSKV